MTEEVPWDIGNDVGESDISSWREIDDELLNTVEKLFLIT